jgi:hypothetical protein
MIDGRRYTGFTGTVSTTEKDALRLDSVADNLTAAMFANGSELLNCALKAVKNVTNTAGDDLEAEAVFIPAYFTLGHGALLGR